MTDRENFDWKKYIDECLSTTDYCALSTVDNAGSWVNPVYFAWDGEFNLYFISQMPSRHMQNLSKDSRVSVAVYSTAQKGDVAGVQLKGDAKILSDEGEIKEAFDIYHGRTGGGEDVKQYIEDPTWIFVKITPNEVSYFDTRFFDEERQTVPMEKLR